MYKRIRFNYLDLTLEEKPKAHLNKILILNKF